MLPELWSLMTTQKWMWAATASGVLFLVIGLTSWRRIRTKVHYETWYFIHLTAYLAVLMGFGHQLTMGSDFVGDKVGTYWWWALYLIVLVVVIVDRFGDLARAFFRRPLRVAAINYEGPNVASVRISGPGLKKLRATAGQYFLLRFGYGDLLWQAHPVSLSAAPTDQALRFTLKNLGDGSGLIHQMPVGTRAYLEGPYGRMTAERAQGERVLLVGGGVGIAPLRAVIEDCTPEQRPVLIVRVRNDADFVHKAEVEALLAKRNGTLYVLSGPRHHFGGGDPFKPEMMKQAVPDVADRHVYICGPESLERAVEKSVRACGVSLDRIHVERFGV
jgi:predicted ferric reductase